MPGNCGGDIRLWIQQGNGISEADHGYRRAAKSDKAACGRNGVYLCTTRPGMRFCFPKMQSELQDLVGTSGKRIGDAVKKSCESDLECLLLGREERVRLHELGMQLGSLDKKQETQIFLQYAEFLEEKRGGLLKEIQEKRRLCNLLGVTAGLFLTILIL